MGLRRRALTLAALVVVSAVAPANAMPDSAGEITFGFVMPDPQLPTRLCEIKFTPASRVTFLSTGLLVGTATERGAVSVQSTGCPSVTWTAAVTVIDSATPRAQRTITGASFGNPAVASATQNVGYAVGVREAGVVTVMFAASSRLGSFCQRDTWFITAAGNPVPAPGPISPISNC